MKQYIVDAFTDRIFSGNPAAVCVLDSWISDELMQNIAIENNLSETAFAVKNGNLFELRWFTPGGEVDLCGHATLATAYVISNFVERDVEKIDFKTMSGILTVLINDDFFEMSFPKYKLTKVEVTEEMEKALGKKPIEAYLGRDLLCIMEDGTIVKNLTPDFEKLKALDGLLVNVTAKGKDFDCVSRSFAPKLNIPEDPVCGSGHCHILPYWANVLNKKELVAFQASKRSGIIYGRVEENRVYLSGKAALFCIADIMI